MEEDRQREQVYLPWHFRDQVFPTRTWSGRVVYNRPKHLFLISDAIRILEKLEAPLEPPKDSKNKFLRVLRASWMLCAGSAVPFPFDKFEDIWDYLGWAVSNTLSILENPEGEFRRRTIELINALADLLGIRIDFLDGGPNGN